MRIVAVFFIVLLIILKGSEFSLVVIGCKRAMKTARLMEKADRKAICSSDFAPPISFIIPFRNETDVIAKVGIVDKYQVSKCEIILIDDGSSDYTSKKIIDSFNLKKTDRRFRELLDHEEIRGIYSDAEKRLNLVLKKRGGYSDCLNAGFNIARFPYCCVIRKGVYPIEDTLYGILTALMREPRAPFLLQGNSLPSSGERIEDGNEKRRGSVGLIRSFFLIDTLFQKMGIDGGLSTLNRKSISSHPLNIYRRENFIVAGGFRPGMGEIAEEMDACFVALKKAEKNNESRNVSTAQSFLCEEDYPETPGAMLSRIYNEGLAKRRTFLKNRDVLSIKECGFSRIAFSRSWVVHYLRPLPEMLLWIFMGIFLFFSQNPLFYFLFIFIFFNAENFAAQLISLHTYLKINKKNFSYRLRMYLVCLAFNTGPFQILLLFRFLGFFDMMRKGFRVRGDI